VTRLHRGGAGLRPSHRPDPLEPDAPERPVPPHTPSPQEPDEPPDPNPQLRPGSRPAV
jgi:hypothetical protein